MKEVKVEIKADGAKNITIHISGMLTHDVSETPILTFADTTFAKLRIESVTFAIQEKAGLYLWWMGKPSTLILPLESRGWFDFEKVGCIQTPPGALGLAISSFKVDSPKGFLLILDGSKQ